MTEHAAHSNGLGDRVLVVSLTYLLQTSLATGNGLEKIIKYPNSIHM